MTCTWPVHDQGKPINNIDYNPACGHAGQSGVRTNYKKTPDILSGQIAGLPGQGRYLLASPGNDPYSMYN